MPPRVAGVGGQIDGADTKSRLREVALELFGAHGIHATTTRDIIKAAGLRNPSAITYYFGSKAELIEDLTLEVNGNQSALLQRHVALAGQEKPLTPCEWAAIGVDFVVNLMSTERGCNLIRLWGEYDGLDPDRVERFLVSTHPLAEAWRDAVVRTFPDLTPRVAFTRNVIVIRTLQWMTVRRARHLTDHTLTEWQTRIDDLSQLMLETSINILTGPTSMTDADFTEH
jgi:AcrR family transcriptional regulator